MDAGRLRVGAALVAGSALLFATKGVAVKLAYPYGVDPLTLLALRYGLALPVFAAIWWREERRAVARGAAPWPWSLYVGAAVLGISGYWLASLLDFLGLRLIPVGLERMVLYVYPTLVVAISALVLRQAVGRLTWVALGATYAGVALTCAGHAPGRGEDAGATALGVALVAASAVAYAVFIVASGPALKRAGPDGSQRLMAVAMSAASVVTLAQGVATHGVGALVAQPAVVWGIGVFLALAATVAPTLLLAEGLRRVGAQRAAVIGAVGPVGTLLAAWAVLGETPMVAEGVGMAVTIAAGVMMGTAGAKAPTAGSARGGVAGNRPPATAAGTVAAAGSPGSA
jgi:drug/metabolite transporter (DMT)-like permease